MKGPPLGPGGEHITWSDQVAPRGRKASSNRNLKPQTSDGQTGSQCFDKAVLEQTAVHCTSKQNVVMSRRTHPKHDTAPVSLYNWHTITFC